MKMIHSTAFSLFGLMLVANGGSAQQCYSCSSCNNAVNTTGASVVSCSTNICYTRTMTVSLLGNTSSLVSRGCVTNGTSIGCFTDGNGTRTCTCFGDKCNSMAVAGSAQQCYSCSNCSDAFSTTGAIVIPCSTNICYTKWTRIPFLGLPPVTSRGCAANGTYIGCVSKGTGVDPDTTCACSGDKCNAPAAGGSEIYCYSCNNCDDPFNTTGATTVPCLSNRCFKSNLTATILGITFTFVSRGCAAVGNATGCVPGVDNASSLVGRLPTICTCSGNKCNTGAARVALIAALVLPLAAAAATLISC